MENYSTFGTTTEPPQEQYDDKSRISPERILQCPFDPHHQIRACRFPYHLVKCSKLLQDFQKLKAEIGSAFINCIFNLRSKTEVNHPKLAKELKTCPFNARHLVPKHELNHHTETCEDRISVDSVPDGEGGMSWQVPVSTWVTPDSSEDWEEDADSHVTPFVWGENTAVNARQMRPTNWLGPETRVPNSLPWLGDSTGIDKLN